MPRTKTSKAKKVKIQKRSLFKKKLMIPAIIAFAVVGGYLLFKSFAATPTLLGNDGEFVAITPARMLDASLAAGQETTLVVLGKNGVPSANIRAVTVNITAAGTATNGGVTTADGYLTVYPSKESRPTASSVNFKKGTAAVANQITVKLGSDGAIRIFNSHGSTRVIVDVSGYYSAEKGSAGSRFVALTPARMLDTSLAAGKEYTLPVLGKNGVPATGVTAVSVNITAAGTSTNGGVTTADGFLTVYPSGVTRPGVSSVNFAKGTAAIANQVEVKVGSDGAIKIYNSGGTTRIIVDVSGYFELERTGSTTAKAGRFVPLTPARIMYGEEIGAGKTYKLDLKGRGGIDISGNVRAAVLNVTASTPSAAGFLTVYPTGVSRPTASSVNFTSTTVAIANQIVVKPGADGSVTIYNSAGNTTVYVDVSGYYVDYEDSGLSSISSGVFGQYTDISKIEYDLYLENLSSSQPVDIQLGDAVTSDYETAPTIILHTSSDSTRMGIAVSCVDSDIKKCTYGLTPKSKETGTNFERVVLPFNLAVGKYKMTYSIATSAGVTKITQSITDPTGKTTKLVTSETKSTALKNLYNFHSSQRNYSCDRPQLMKYSVGNILYDGKPFIVGGDYLYAQTPICAGHARVQPVIKGASSSTAKLFTVQHGIAAASRDTASPTISLSWNATTNILTVTASDNTMLSGYTRQDASSNYYSTIGEKTFTQNFEYNSSLGFPVGNHKVTYTATDSSGNMVTKTTTINVTK